MTQRTYENFSGLGHHHRNRRLFSEMVEAGFLIEQKGIYAVPSLSIFAAGPIAWNLYPFLFPTQKRLYASQLARIADTQTISHDLKVQSYCSRLSNSRNVLRTPPGHPGSLAPDALIPDGSKITALEIELSQKNKSRIYRAFNGHVEALARGDYHHVRYVFESDSILRNYLAMFNESQWPEFHSTNRNYKTTGCSITIPANHAARSRFSFALDSALLGAPA